MKVVQFSKTPLAGAPIRIAQAVNDYTNVTVRHVDLNRWGIYDHDHIHQENPDETWTLAKEADIIHIYNYVHLDCHDFAPVDFRELQRLGKQFVWHFESTPMLVAEHAKISLDSILNSPIPQLVIAQYPERFLKNAMVVPNIIPQNSPDYCFSTELSTIDLVYCPTKTLSAWEDRWNTKGMPETVRVLERLQQNYNARIQVYNGKPLTEVMKGKRAAKIILDEMITGSYHLSALEGLSCGKPTLSYLDSRTEYVLREISGSASCPFINVRLEDAYEVLVHLLNHPEKIEEIGKASRQWIDKYWQDRILAHLFADVYEKLLENPNLITRQESLRFDNKTTYFQAVILPDLVYVSRSNNFKEKISQLQLLLKQLKHGGKKFRKWTRNLLAKIKFRSAN
jgi:hypothetical protein